MIILRRSNQQEKMLHQSLLSRRVASTYCPKCDLRRTPKWLRLCRRAWRRFLNISSKWSKKLAVKRVIICIAPPAAPQKPSTVYTGARWSVVASTLSHYRLLWPPHKTNRAKTSHFTQNQSKNLSEAIGTVSYTEAKRTKSQHQSFMGNCLQQWTDGHRRWSCTPPLPRKRMQREARSKLLAQINRSIVTNLKLKRRRTRLFKWSKTINRR